MIKSTQIIFEMNIKPLKTKKDYSLAMKRLEKIFDSKPGTPEGEIDMYFVDGELIQPLFPHLAQQNISLLQGERTSVS